MTSRLAVEAGASSGNSKEVQSSERKASNEPGVDRNSGVNDDTTAEDSGGGIRCSQTVNVVYGVFMPSDLEQMDDETGGQRFQFFKSKLHIVSDLADSNFVLIRFKLNIADN